MTELLRELCEYPNGQVALGGKLLEHYRRLDAIFAGWGIERGAAEYLYPAMVPARVLDRIDYLSSFPHLATLPVTLAQDEDNIARFVAERGDPDDLNLTELAPVRDVLTPAVCYHVYQQFADTDIKGPIAITTRGTCFRRERAFTPLERLWSFSMREIVLLGTRDDVGQFLEWARSKVNRFVAQLDVGIEWVHAVDPFFRPIENPHYLTQRLDPVKHEMVFDGRLALGSINAHRDHFGRAFAITIGGEPVTSACVAFGLERWLAALRSRFGDDLANSPLGSS